MQLEGLVIPISFNTGALLQGVKMITGLIEDAVSATFEWADGMDHLGDVTGMTADQTAAWAFVAKKAGVEVDALANSAVILAKGLFDSEGQLSTTGKALEDFGVSVRDASGNVKDQSILMDDIASRYAEFGTQTERVDFLTNIFGRSGANLVDVFDTLAQEGGIDAVTQKVKDLGLAIDPDRYEQFTRNLEELKLAGTGLAIQFVDQLMPVFERVLKWAQQFQGMAPEEIFSRIGAVISELPEKFENWAKSINWETVSQDLIDGINNIDWAAVGKWVAKAGGHLRDGIDEIFLGVDWTYLFSSIGIAFMNFATGLAGGDFQKFKASWANNWRLAKDIVANAVSAMQSIVLKWLGRIPGEIESFFSQATGVLKEWVGKMVAILGGLTSALTGAAGAIPGTGSVGSIVGHAAGGRAGGMTWVGESGPELVNLPSGSYVNNNQSSNRMAAQGPTEAYIDYDRLARTLARVLGQQMQRA